ncbi:MAG: hypothetical protein ACK5LS_14045 [Propioniciclava sp.]
MKLARLYAIGLTLLGVFLLVVTPPTPTNRIVGWLTVAFFGVGTLILFTRRPSLESTPQRGRAVFHAMIPDDITVERETDIDAELDEYWVHSSATQPLLHVDAVRWKEPAEYQWSVSVVLAELAQGSESAPILDLAIDDALAATAQVVEVHRDDTETWVVSGSPRGEDLVRNVGAAVTSSLPRVVDDL